MEDAERQILRDSLQRLLDAVVARYALPEAPAHPSELSGMVKKGVNAPTSQTESSPLTEGQREGVSDRVDDDDNESTTSAQDDNECAATTSGRCSSSLPPVGPVYYYQV